MILSRPLVLIETSAWIEAMRSRGDEKIRARVHELIDDGRAAWCHMVRLELWAGAQAREIPRLDEFRRLIGDLPTTEAVWEESYRLAQRARAKGFTFPATDLLIASCARHYGVEILHRDQHFDQIKTI